MKHALLTTTGWVKVSLLAHLEKAYKESLITHVGIGAWLQRLKGQQSLSATPVHVRQLHCPATSQALTMPGFTTLACQSKAPFHRSLNKCLCEEQKTLRFCGLARGTPPSSPVTHPQPAQSSWTTRPLPQLREVCACVCCEKYIALGCAGVVPCLPSMASSAISKKRKVRARMICVLPMLLLGG